jgi:hypothetical protein
LADEDDELSEVQPDAVPPEVREWLASTFTRQLATTRKKSDEKPKFRSVAHAIRAGIFVDRIYRRVSSTALMQFPPEVVKVLKVRQMFVRPAINHNVTSLPSPRDRGELFFVSLFVLEGGERASSRMAHGKKSASESTHAERRRTELREK